MLYKDEEEKRQRKIVKKFGPWFPWRTDIPVPDEPMPEMSVREALAICEYESQCLYDGSTTLAGMGSYAWNVIENFIDDHEA